MFANKKILIGVTGGIAAYKTCEIIRELKRNHAEVRVVMTKAATEFITPLTFVTLSENPVLMEMFADNYSTTTIHIEAARWADTVLICPATANTIGKIASGIADNLLTTLVMATTSPVVFCPAMNKEMFTNSFYQQNVEKLKQTGYHFVQSEIGELACGEFGWGRLADSVPIINRLKKILLGTDELNDKNVLVTAGRTEEPLDPIRFVTNYSSGKMGFALAESAALKGAEVTLIAGPNNLKPFDGIKYIQIQTSDQMAIAVNQELANQDVVIMAAAVADFKPTVYFDHKIKKNSLATTIKFVKTNDILRGISNNKGNKILVGFAVETENELASAKKKLFEKNLDLIVVNNPLEQGAGFGTDTNIVTLIDARENIEKLPLMSKSEVANKIIDKVIHLMNK
ncbi:MAG: bifunctional phosphopantothenoylcysteine decarboxylase/phosphopantothenate--cysteine ligase CoaBC [bacterium]|nr:MAG: bifunctional phosphopantothenoylcysteine decarboxylase/phosphopantothenate--cysteine ligase CoaBC [bacterium]